MWQVVLTVLSGVTIYVVGQMTIKLFVDPWHDYLMLKGQIIDALSFYANVTANPGRSNEELMLEANRAFRKLGSNLLSRKQAIWSYALWAKLGALPTPHEFENAYASLIGLSNGVFTSGDARMNEDRRRTITKGLRLDTL